MAAARGIWRMSALVCAVLLAALAARCGDASLHGNFGSQHGGAPAFAAVQQALAWRMVSGASPRHLRWCPAPPGPAAAPCHLVRWGARPFFHHLCSPRTGTALHNVRTGREFVDHYRVLGVSSDAEPGEIKRVFRALSRKYHPDVCEGRAEEVYLRITGAYNVLSDPDRRASYDQTRLHHLQAAPDGRQELVAAFESELTKQCDCNCDATVHGTPLNKNKMQRGGKARADSAPQNAATTADYFGDEDRVITPPSTYQELSSFLVQAKRASYSRPSIYTCSKCGAASANRDKCDVCGTMQWGPAQPRGRQESMFPIYSMHKFGSHLHDDHRHELVHKHHIARNAPSHTWRPMQDDLGMPDVADIDTGAQRIWGQVSPSVEIPDAVAPFGSGRFEADLDFFGFTHEPPPMAKTRVEEAGRALDTPVILSGTGGGVSGWVSPATEGEMRLDAISGGCWLFSDMDSDVSGGEQQRDQERAEQLERERAEAIQIGVLQKESQVAKLEAKVEERKRELAELERELVQARSELVRAKAQQGWSGAGAVGMGGAGAVFSDFLFHLEGGTHSPAAQLSIAFSTLSPPGPRTPQEQQQTISTFSTGVGAVGMGGAGAVFSDFLFHLEGGTHSPAPSGPVDNLSEQVFSGEFRRSGVGAGEEATPSRAASVRQCVHHSAPRDKSSLLDPPKICGACGCISVSSIRCDCCGSPIAPEQKASEGKHAGLTKVYTMHSRSRTRLSEEVMHTLVHPRHHSEHHAESVEEGALQGRFDVGVDYFGIAAPVSPTPADGAAGLQKWQPSNAQKSQPLHPLARGQAAQAQVAATSGPGVEEAVEGGKSGYSGTGTLDELNQYLSTQHASESGLPGRSTEGGVRRAIRSATPDAAAATSALERETPDVPWQMGGGLEATDDGIGLGAFNRLVAETQGWLGEVGDGDETREDDVPSSMWSEESDGDEAQENRRKAAAVVAEALQAASALDTPVILSGTGGGVRGWVSPAMEGERTLGSEDQARAADADPTLHSLSPEADASTGREGGKEGETEAEKEEREERRRLEDLTFFVSQMKAYSSRLKVEAERAAVLVTEMEGVFIPQTRSGAPPPVPSGAAGVRDARGGVSGEVRPMATQPVTSSVESGTLTSMPAPTPACPPAVPKKRRILSVSAKRYVAEGAPEADIRRQRGSGVFGVYTMHGSPATHLADDDRHTLMHMNHIPSPAHSSPAHSSPAHSSPAHSSTHPVDSQWPADLSRRQLKGGVGGGGRLSRWDAAGGSAASQPVEGRNSLGREDYDEAMAMKDACRPCVEIEEMLGVKKVCVLCCMCACDVYVLVWVRVCPAGVCVWCVCFVCCVCMCKCVHMCVCVCVCVVCVCVCVRAHIRMKKVCIYVESTSIEQNKEKVNTHIQAHTHTQAIGKVKQELRQLQALRLEARKLKRESEALDLVVHRFVSMPAISLSLSLSLSPSLSLSLSPPPFPSLPPSLPPSPSPSPRHPPARPPPTRPLSLSVARLRTGP
jgi:hypothetical protein